MNDFRAAWMDKDGNDDHGRGPSKGGAKGQDAHSRIVFGRRGPSKRDPDLVRVKIVKETVIGGKLHIPHAQGNFIEMSPNWADYHAKQGNVEPVPVVSHEDAASRAAKTGVASSAPSAKGGQYYFVPQAGSGNIDVYHQNDKGGRKQIGSAATASAAAAAAKGHEAAVIRPEATVHPKLTQREKDRYSKK